MTNAVISLCSYIIVQNQFVCFCSICFLQLYAGHSCNKIFKINDQFTFNFVPVFWKYLLHLVPINASLQVHEFHTYVYTVWSTNVGLSFTQQKSCTVDVKFMTVLQALSSTQLRAVQEQLCEQKRYYFNKSLDKIMTSRRQVASQA